MIVKNQFIQSFYNKEEIKLAKTMYALRKIRN